MKTLILKILTNLACVAASVMSGTGVTEEKANTPPWQWRWRGLGLSANHPIHFLRETVPFTFSSSFFPTLACESLPSKNQPKIALGGVGTLMWWTVAWMVCSLSLSLWQHWDLSSLKQIMLIHFELLPTLLSSEPGSVLIVWVTL